jgi:hypothetical protein
MSKTPIRNRFVLADNIKNHLFCALKVPRLSSAWIFSRKGTAIVMLLAALGVPFSNGFVSTPPDQYRNGDGIQSSIGQWAELHNANLSAARAILLQNGKLLLQSSKNNFLMWDPATNQVVPISNGNVSTLIDVSATATTVLDLDSETPVAFDPRILDNGNAVMYLPGLIMKSGSSSGSQSDSSTSKKTYLMDASAKVLAWQEIPSMAFPRKSHNLTILPDGSVLATGGETESDAAGFPAEIWSPETKKWATVSGRSVPLTSDSIALLLPDGRIFVSDSDDENNAAIFSPPYLFKGARPVITGAPGFLSYGASAFIETQDSDSIAGVSLVRTGPVSRSFSEDQRFIPLSFHQVHDGIEITVPQNANLAPPGSYLLFLLNNSGVPSNGSFIELASSDNDSSPMLIAADTTALASGVTGVATDAIVSKDQSTSSTIVTTTSFSTSSANELLLAFVSAGYSSASNSVSSITGAGLTWQRVVRTNAQYGTAEIWRAFASATLSNVSVTARLSRSAPSSLTVISFTGVNTSGTNGSGAIGATKSVSASAGAPSATLTTTRDQSLVFGVGNDVTRATARTVGSNQTMVHQYLSTSAADTYWLQKTTNPISPSGTIVTINDTAPTNDRYNLSLCEIVPTVPDTTSPTVSMTAPNNGATVSGAVTISATASDNVSVSGVQFLLDGNSLGTEITVAPYSISWNTTTASVGPHSLAASARDAAGNKTTSPAITITVANSSSDTTPPTVAMTAPANGVTVSSTTTVSASASDNTAVAGVQFLLDGVNLGAEDIASPFSIDWNTTTAAAGQHRLSATARDAAGNKATSPAITVIVPDTTFPTVAVMAPANGDIVSGSAVIISASASDNVGVVGVQFRIDGSIYGAEDTSNPFSVTWDTTGIANGSHFLTAIARDAAGNSNTSASVTITVYNGSDIFPPSVALTSPVNGATVTGNAVTVAATATDNATIVGVQFKLDGSNLGTEDTTSPYSVSWNAASTTNGSHILAAVARDAAGNTATSSISAFVNNSVGTVDLTVNGNQRFQTFDGFMVNANSAAWNNGELKPAIDLLIDQGVAVFRVIIDNEDWESANDNDDPTTFNWDYYNTVFTTAKFENLWSTIGYLNQKGITNGVLLNFMGPTPSWMGSPALKAGYEEEWAEMIAALIYYARATRNLQFTQVGPANEVDWNGIEGPQIGSAQYTTALHKLAQKLDSIGLSDIRLVAPDTAEIGNGTTNYLWSLLSDNVVMAKISHFGFHNYYGSTGSADTEIKISSYPDRNFWMTEGSFGNDYYGPDHMMDLIKGGAASAGVWDAYESDYNHMPNDSYPMIDHSGYGVWTPNVNYYAYKQLFKFVRPGATRIADTISASGLYAVAFYNLTSGQVTVVGHNSGGDRNLRIFFSNLPVNSLKYYQTDVIGTRKFQQQTDPVISNGVVTIAVGGYSYFTLTSGDITPPTAPSNLTALGSELRATLSWTGSTDNSGAITYNVHRSTTSGFTPASTNRVGQTGATTYVDSAAAGTYFYRVAAQDSAGNVSSSSNEAAVTIQPDLTPPSVQLISPSNGANLLGIVNISANASDTVAVAGVQFKLGNLALGSELSSIPYSLNWDTTTVANGQYILSAVARDSSGNSSVSSININVANPLTISTVSAGSITQSSAVISWNTNIAANSQVNYGLTANYGTTTIDPASTTTHSLILSGLNSGTLYHYQVISGAASSSDFTFTTASPPDLTAPEISISSPAQGANVSGSNVAIQAIASDNIGVVGVQFKLDGINLGTEDISYPYSIAAWDSTTVPNGSHTITAVARDAAGNSKESAVIAFTVSNSAQGLALDVVTYGDRATISTTVATGTFSTKATNELLLAFISADNVNATNTNVTAVTGAGLTWQLILRTNVQRGTAEIWRAFAASSLSSVSVTATLSQSVCSSITVVSLTGADTSGSYGSGAIGATASANAISGAPTASLTTTRANSWVFGVGVDWDNPIARTVGSNQTLIHQYMPPVGDTYWVQRTTSPTAVIGTKVTINDTAPTGDRYNLSICEVLPKQ